MPDNLKKLIKNIFKMNVELSHSSMSKENYSQALNEYIDENPDYINNRNYMLPRKDHDSFYPAIKEMEPSFNFFAVDVYNYGSKRVKDIFEYDGLHSGTPMKTKPFPLAKQAVKRAMNAHNLYWYPSSTGDNISKQKVVNYLIKEGFPTDCLGIENITFTCSTTHAYSLVLKTIAHDKDVILMTGPNYGLFAIMTELTSAHLEILDLKEEDNWYVNAQDLSNKIDEINEQLKKKYQKTDLNYQPKVVAFLNINPHNPTGKVMSKKNKKILEDIGEVCLNKGVFVIDDLIYRDLTYDQDNLALPMATYSKYFNNTISLFGLSKAYGLASLRSAFLVAPTPIIRAIAIEINHSMDSLPTPLVKAVAASFNDTPKRYKTLKKYLIPIISEYQFRYNLLKSFVEGLDSVPLKYHNEIKYVVSKYIIDKHYCDKILQGLKDVHIKKGTEPESGFFAILDFTQLKGSKTKNYQINNDKDLLRYLYEQGKVRFIMGSNMCWPNKDEIIARVSFGLERQALVYNFEIIHKSLEELTR